MELEKKLDEITMDSDEYDQTGKTQEQLDYRDVTASRMEANHRRALEGTECSQCSQPFM
jgi:hypothetical protein